MTGMSHDLDWMYAFNLIVNSLLSFITLTVLIHLILALLPLEQPRFRAWIQCIPLLKMGIDPFLYDWENGALLHQINPLETEIGSRSLNATLAFSFPPTHLTQLVFSLQEHFFYRG